MRYVTVRYGQMYYRGHFVVKDGIEVAREDLCLIQSPRGTELGKVLCEPTEFEGEVVWLKNSKTHGDRSDNKGKVLYLSGEIIRRATEDDLDKVFTRFGKGTREEEEFCRERIKANELPMKLAGVEYLFEGEKIIFYFLADGRVDFRNLVKDLAKKYRTRIEMKQIGVRDEARLLAEYEHCGRRLCCKNFLNYLEPVTMKMAKAQKTTLDPSKISGRCGRLMCCLRYEDHIYQELKKSLPKKGTHVRLKEGRAKVLSHDILLQKILVEGETGVQHFINMDEVLEVLPKTREEGASHAADSSEDKRASGKSSSKPHSRSQSKSPSRPRSKSHGRQSRERGPRSKERRDEK